MKSKLQVYLQGLVSKPKGLPRVWLTPDLGGFGLGRKDVPAAKPYPRELLDDVLAVALQGQASLKQIAKDFGIPKVRRRTG